MTMTEQLRRIAEIDVEIAALAEEAKQLRAAVASNFEGEKKVLVDGRRVWTIEPSKDGKDFNVTYFEDAIHSFKKKQIVQEPSTLEVFVVATVSGRIMFHTFSLWRERCIYKFCPRDAWPGWEAVGYHVRRMTLTDHARQKPWSEIRKEFCGERLS